ncbi:MULTISPECIES: MFS transporter [unclassified Roseovarius]|uniref:MFS transporter n=1 Tax=unclassified Roseovarius TaxID=2614913 RepID=UPI00273DD059|nr:MULTISPECIES: MFS transporter [unclassified Roseovarius]
MAEEQTGARDFVGLLTANTVLGVAMPMLIILGGLAGLMLAPGKALATFPPSVQMLAGLAAAGPFSLLMGRLGRTAGFLLGGAIATLGGVIGTFALLQGSFLLLCLSHVFFGAALACYQYFRFAAAEVVPDRWQPVAISLMLTSGLVAALVGPQIFIATKDFFAPVPLAGAYAAISVVSLLGMIPLAIVRMPGGTAPGRGPRRAKVSAALRRGPVIKAVVIAGAAQGFMVLLMAPTPLAMIGCGLGETMAGDVIRWHVVAMFAPSFVTGFVIKRVGAQPVALCGLALLGASAAVAASGLSALHFYLALILLGIGWNFGFIGATAMLSSALAPEERAGVQGANDTIVALASTVCAFASGAVVTGLGWISLNLIALPILICVIAGVLVFSRRKMAAEI